jgi:hypothetical protein
MTQISLYSGSIGKDENETIGNFLRPLARLVSNASLRLIGNCKGEVMSESGIPTQALRIVMVSSVTTPSGLRAALVHRSFDGITVGLVLTLLWPELEHV